MFRRFARCFIKRSLAIRRHHLLKTFWGWRDQQRPDGTVIWKSPSGQTYTTRPDSWLLFPTLCRPTAPVVRRGTPNDGPGRGLIMLRRKTTRAQDRAKRIDAKRPLNDNYVAQRDKPPPF